MSRSEFEHALLFVALTADIRKLLICFVRARVKTLFLAKSLELIFPRSILHTVFIATALIHYINVISTELANIFTGGEGFFYTTLLGLFIEVALILAVIDTILSVISEFENERPILARDDTAASTGRPEIAKVIQLIIYFLGPLTKGQVAVEEFVKTVIID
jgi:hypothetical protein